MEKLEVDYLVIGAGVVGLAVSESLSRRFPDATGVLIEKNLKFGQDISSHNSEVIHAGIYYENSPLKSKHCIRGKDLLYSFCKKYDVPFSNCGKYILATTENQLPALDGIRKGALQVGVELTETSVGKVSSELQNPNIIACLWSPTTGIVDSHLVMERLLHLSEVRGVIPLLGCEISSLERVDSDQVNVTYQDRSGNLQEVRPRVLVNCAGLASASLAKLLRPEIPFSIRPCRGRYFSLSSRFTGLYHSLVYPIPDPAGGLGVHITFDLSGKCRLGPDVDWSRQFERPDEPHLYDFSAQDDLALSLFVDAGRRLIPNLKACDLSSDYIGVRPKLFKNEQPYNDFTILHSENSDWHLLGIESPGLTAALSLAEEISQNPNLESLILS